MVDANVTGSNAGTSDDPKFPLKGYFEHCIIEAIAELVGEGGKYEGYTPVTQGDQAGPHTEAGFTTWIKEEFERRGWMWEQQAPHMPTSNSCDLQVFPCMSRRHAALIRKCGKSVASKDTIYKCATTVWEKLPACIFARSFIHAWRLLTMVIKHKGDNSFLKTPDFHQNVRKDFTETKTGVKPCTKKRKR